MASQESFQKQLKLQKLAQVVCEIALVSQFVIVIVYWTQLHKHTLIEVAQLSKTDPKFAESFLSFIIDIHIFPFSTVFANILMSKIVFQLSDMKYSIVYGTTYSFVNFVSTQFSGRYIYPFMTWESPASLIVCAAIVGFNCLIFFLMTKIFQNRMIINKKFN
ncbi:UNKNOWN [Stylonychia lemnae]|uniref:Transmembrane protein n=1 Tax=Stylonychia lemnae TaxID=5949 RepID=A0A077ZXY4_STYLE|nr:UNKNOWN [Stylonychia lemnae]|eukprot:CDW74750.1 UNKNOWN [Stylonychia lemnae]